MFSRTSILVKKRRWPRYLGVVTATAALGTLTFALWPPRTKSTANSQQHSDFISHRSTPSLLRSLIVYQLCQYEVVVDWAPSILNAAQKVHLQTLSNALVKWTFFKQFCGGESAKTVAPTMRYLRGYGIGSILDLSVEADVGPKSEDVNSSDTASETVTKLVIKCIETAGTMSGNYAAVKVTGFGDIKAMENVSAALSYMHDAFKYLSMNNGGFIDKTGFNRLMTMMPGTLSEDSIDTLFAKINKDGNVDWIDFSDVVSPLNTVTRPLFIGQIKRPPRLRVDDLQILDHHYLAPSTAHEVNFGTTDAVDALTRGPHVKYLVRPSDDLWSVSEKFLPSVSEHDLRQLDGVISRMNRVCDVAHTKRVQLMVDAEQSYFQPVIDLVTLDLMRRYNILPGSLGPLVFNTYQMYLRDGLSKLATDIERAERSGKYLFAAKLVRGAYLNSERLRASILELRDPINESPEATHSMYNRGIELVLKSAAKDPIHQSSAVISAPRIGVVIATHNSKSIQVAVEGLKRYNLHPKSGVVGFAQLLGMYDFLTYKLAEDGYLVYKYIPYGPVKDVIPYLLRRAQENKAVLRGSMDGAVDDRQLIWQELQHRCRVMLHLDSSNED